MIMEDRYINLINRTQVVNKRLRNALFKATKKMEDIRRVPFHGKMANGMPTESLGPFPEFILPTHPCLKTLQGYCSPCFFSKVPMSVQSRDQIYDSLIVQTEYIVEHFDDVVIGFQAREDHLKDIWDVTFCYACNGSLFSDAETTRKTRKQVFQMLVDEIEKRKLKPLVYIETCVCDYINFLNSEEYKDIYPLLKKLNAIILFGFESVNDITRNLIYLKGLELNEFEQAVMRNNEIGLQTGAFLYLGFHSMTQLEIIEDATKSLCYLNKLNVMPVLMYPNIHEFTLTHLLYTYGKYNLIDPRTAWRIFEIAEEITSEINVKRDRWLMGDLYGGPPVPPNNFFNNKYKISCDSCSELIRTNLQRKRKNQDIILGDEINKKLENCSCSCNNKYLEYIEKERDTYGKRDILDRIEENIIFAEQHCDEYINKMGINKNE